MARETDPTRRWSIDVPKEISLQQRSFCRRGYGDKFHGVVGVIQIKRKNVAAVDII